MGSDPFGRAIRDHYLGERQEPLIDRDGDETRQHKIDHWYFTEFEGDEFLDAWLDGPLLDMGAGVGRHARYYQDQFETVAIEESALLVKTMRERGVEDAREGDMFALREQFERDRFQSALAIGTQLNLAGSMDGLRRFLADLAHVTTPEATAIVDSYHPARSAEMDAFGFRTDPTPGMAYRIMHCEYEGVDEPRSSARQTESDGEVGETLLFRLFSPDRLREAAIGTEWEVAEVREHPPNRETPVQYRAALTKSD